MVCGAVGWMAWYYKVIAIIASTSLEAITTQSLVCVDFLHSVK